MKTKKIFLSLCLFSLCFYSGKCLNCVLNRSLVLDQENRTATYSNKSLNEEGLYESFDEYYLSENNNGFKIDAKKKYNSTSFSNLDLVALDLTDDYILVGYNISYIDNKDVIVLSITIENNNDKIVDELPGIVTTNDDGKTDVLFIKENENIWLSDLVNNDLIKNDGFFSWLSFIFTTAIDALKVAFTTVLTFFLNGLELVKDIVTLNFNKAQANFGAMLLNMYEEVDKNGKGKGRFHFLGKHL